MTCRKFVVDIVTKRAMNNFRTKIVGPIDEDEWLTTPKGVFWRWSIETQIGYEDAERNKWRPYIHEIETMVNPSIALDNPFEAVDLIHYDPPLPTYVPKYVFSNEVVTSGETKTMEEAKSQAKAALDELIEQFSWRLEYDNYIKGVAVFYSYGY